MDGAQALADALEEAASGAAIDLLQQLRATGLASDVVADIWKVIVQRMKEAGIELGKTNSKARQLGILFDAASIADGAVQAASAIFNIGKESEQAARHVVSLAEGIGRIALGDIVGGITQGLGAIAGLFGGGETARDRLIRENNEALADAAAAFRGIGDSAAEAASISAAALAKLEFIRAIIADDEANMQKFNDQLKEAGVSLEDIQRFAEARGLSILDEKGKLVASELEKVAAAAEIFIKQITTFGDSISDERQKLELQNKLFGGSADPELDTLNIDKTLLERLLGDQFDAILAGIDVNTAEGQEAYRKFLQDLFTMFDQGFFTDNPGQLEGTIDDFIGIADSSADALDALGTSARDAVSGLLNVPTGFKIALARFNSTLTEDLDRRVKEIATGGGLNIDPVRFPQPFRGTDGATLPTLGEAVGQIINNFEPGSIVVQGSADPHATAQAVLAEFRTRAGGQSGDTMNWGRLV